MYFYKLILVTQSNNTIVQRSSLPQAERIVQDLRHMMQLGADPKDILILAPYESKFLFLFLFFIF